MALPSHISAAPVSAGSRTPVYALVGNPNCGKSTLFNALTGLKQKVGNYPSRYRHLAIVQNEVNLVVWR